MYVLGIESATAVAAVAIAGNEGILAERMVHNKRTHSVNLLPMIKATLEDAELKGTELAGIAVSGGPGSFTGLRIGMSIAKTLAQVWGLPVVGVSTLQSLAYQLSGHYRLVCPIMNARKNEVYTAVYGNKIADGQMELLVSPRAVGIKELIDLLAEWSHPVTFLGDGTPVYKEQLIEGIGQRAFFAPASVAYPSGAAIAELGLINFAGKVGVSPLVLQPEYIRFSEAEVLWRKKQSAGG